MDMNGMKLERARHRKQAVVKLVFAYDAALVAELRRQLPGARWSKTMRCWWVPDTAETAEVLSLKFKVQSLESVATKTSLLAAAQTSPPALPTGEGAKPQQASNDGREDLIARFGNYMKERRYSARTIEGYTECMRIFFDFLGWKDILEIDNRDVDDFNCRYILARKLSATYQSQFVSAIKLFFEKIPRKRLSVEQVERPRRGRPLPKVISKADVARIIDCTGNLKHRAMLSVLYSCGLRRSELLDMRIVDIDSKRNVVNIRRAKGDKDRQVPLSPKILEMLREYYKQYHPVTWLFEGDKPNTPYAAESLQKVFTEAKRKAGITAPFKLHGLRHCYATHLMESGVGIRYIQELLGHRHIKTTEIYTHVSSEAIGQIQSPFDTLDIGTKPLKQVQQSFQKSEDDGRSASVN